MHRPCGNAEVLALGLCATCYTLRRQDEEYFGGLREAVLVRDGNRCRVCDASGRNKRSIIVRHRVPGKSILSLMLSLCPACHAKIHRTKAVLSVMPPLLLQLWREQHPDGHEQVQLDFPSKKPSVMPVRLFTRKENVSLQSLSKLIPYRDGHAASATRKEWPADFGSGLRMRPPHDEDSGS